MSEDISVYDEGTKQVNEKSTIHLIINIVLVIIIIALGVIGAKWLIKTGPKIEKTVIHKTIKKVEIITLESSTETVIIKGTGTAIPARTISLQPRINGEIISVSPRFEEGEFFVKNEILLQIDKRDYELIIKEVNIEIESLKNDLKIEDGNARVAQKELTISGLEKSMDKLEKDLTLRKPQIAKIKNAIQKANVKLEQIKLNLERTVVKVPFNSYISQKNTDIGSQIGPQNKIATLIGTDEFYVKVTLSEDKLHWINIPDVNNKLSSEVTIILSKNNKIKGSIVRLLPKLEELGRMANILISVKDPLALNLRKSQKKLLLNKYVSVEFKGKLLENVIKIKRETLREKSTIWTVIEIVTENQEIQNILKTQKVNVVWKDYNFVYITNNNLDNTKIITSDVPDKIEGMLVKY